MYENPYEKNTNPYTIEAERESVCMGDDCNAPHYVHLEYNPNQLLSEWMLNTVLGYVPIMRGCVWAVFSGNRGNKKLLGYLVGDKETDTEKSIINSLIINLFLFFNAYFLIKLQLFL